jgi:hypothetical protein
MIRFLATLALVLIGACAPNGDTPEAGPGPASDGGDRLVGTVRIVGSAPMNVQVVLQPAQGRSVRLAGPLLPELERLAGAEVAVTGQIEPAPDPLVDRQVQVSEYEILSINGEPVVMGDVVSVANGWVQLRTPTGEEIFLSGAPAEFQVGQRVWVQGPHSIAVQSHGTLRP